MSTGSGDIIGLYLNDIGKMPLLDGKEEERQLAQAIEAGREAHSRYEELMEKIGHVSLSDIRVARNFLNEHAPAARATSPYLQSLQNTVETYQESRELRRSIREGDEAKDRFIRSNLRLVVSIARRYPLPQGMDLLDLIQEGNLGLEHAVDKFDWRRGFKFSTYATFWIRQAIGRSLDQKASLIRIPYDQSARLRGAQREAQGDDESLSPEMAELHILANPVSLDKNIGHMDDATLGDMIASDEEDSDPAVQLMLSVESEMFEELLSGLDKRARYAVEVYFGLLDGERKSFKEVGERLGVTGEAARRLVSRSVAGLRSDAERIFEISTQRG